jgi:CheY-like chemotaxis protein
MGFGSGAIPSRNRRNRSEREGNYSAYGTLATFTVCADSDFASIIRSASANVPGVEYAGEFQDYITAERRPNFPPAIKRADSCVTFIDFDLHSQYTIKTVETLRRHHTPQIISIGVATKLDTDLLVRAMRAGCSEFLAKPLPVARLQETMHQIQDRLQASSATPARYGRVITCLGAKGAVGTTVLAVHVAISLASKHGEKTLLGTYQVVPNAGTKVLRCVGSEEQVAYAISRTNGAVWRQQQSENGIRFKSPRMSAPLTPYHGTEFRVNHDTFVLEPVMNFC